MIAFLEDECVFDEQRLPSYTPLPIIAALWENLPQQPDKLGNARIVLRKFMWRSFLTSRYEQASATNALQDFRAMKRILLGGPADDSVPVLNEKSYPLPAKELLLEADWPKRRTILGRGLLAIQLKCGADDLADGARATVASITSKDTPREYHHLFPEATLADAGVPSEQIDRELNCALITWRTNRTISNKDPIAYLKERADNSALGQAELQRRLKTHLIPYAPLAVGYDGLDDEERRARVKADYEVFLDARGDLLARAVEMVCAGKSIDLDAIFSQAQ